LILIRLCLAVQFPFCRIFRSFPVRLFHADIGEKWGEFAVGKVKIGTFTGRRTETLFLPNDLLNFFYSSVLRGLLSCVPGGKCGDRGWKSNTFLPFVQNPLAVCKNPDTVA
jgi:hypothetical protein